MKPFYTLVILAFFLIHTRIQAQQIIQMEYEPSPTGVKLAKAESTYGPPEKPDVVANISRPSLTAYLPAPEKANGTALIIAPGGGFHFLAFRNEGTDLAAWCVEHGIAAFVLKYRVVPTTREPWVEFGEKLEKDREKMDKEMAPVIELAKADGRAAIEHVRSHAKDYGIKPDRVGIIGFSAGGTLAAAAAFEYTSKENRPDFVAPIYPALHVVKMDSLPADPMPMFVAVANDDNFGFQMPSIDLYKKWSQASLPIELHIYEKGGHGFGMKKQGLPSDKWVDAFWTWLQDLFEEK